MLMFEFFMFMFELLLMLMFEFFMFMFELLLMLIFELLPMLIFELLLMLIFELPVDVEPVLPVEVEPLFMFDEFMFVEFIIIFEFLFMLLLALLAVPGSQAMLIAPNANIAERAKVFFILKSISCLLKKIIYFIIYAIG
jgi:hypothetical protein